MDKEWLGKFFSEKDLWPNRTGQGPVESGAPAYGGRYDYDETKDIKNRNLGLGWLYYGLARLYQPKVSLIIGSGRGFFPILTAKGISENNNEGILHFIDPSLDDNFWKDRNKNKQRFSKYGIDNVIRHYLLKTQDFIKTDVYKNLKNIEFLGIDGSHFYEYVKFDFESFQDKLSSRAVILFHDSISRSKNPKWSGPRKFILELLKDEKYQQFDFKFGAGLTLIQKKYKEHQQEYLDELVQNWPDNNDESF